ncbi:MAG: DUF350 domain-containing protein [Myxococcales bacterium]
MQDHPLYLLGFAAVTTLVLVLLAQLIERLLFPALQGRNNHAASLLHAGRYFGVFSVSAAVVSGSVHGENWRADVLWVAVYGLSAVVVLDALARAGIYVLLRSRLPKEIAESNVAAGLAAGAHYAATGIILSRSLSGHGLKDLGISVAFFVLGQITLHLFVILFRAVTTYDDSKEILGNNLAAAMSYAGVTVALALIIGHATEGTFVNWNVSLRAYAIALLVAFALYPVRQLLVQSLMLGGKLSLRRGALDQGIAEERNVGVSVLEAGAYLATAFLISRL